MWQCLYACNKCWQLPAQQLFPSNADCCVTQISKCQPELRTWMKRQLAQGLCLEKMFLSLVRGSSSLKEEQQVSLNFQVMPKSPAFKDKACLLLASLRSISDKNCCEPVRSAACFFPTWWCHDDPGFQLLRARLFWCVLIENCMLSSGLFNTGLCSLDLSP